MLKILLGLIVGYCIKVGVFNPTLEDVAVLFILMAGFVLCKFIIK